MPSIDILREALDTDFCTGEMRWKVRPRSHFPSDQEMKRWNTRHAGKLAGNITKFGHRQFKLLGRLIYVHRAMWKMFHEAEPTGLVQHWDGNSSDNRPSNLIDDSHDINMQNKKLGKNNTTGFRGARVHGTRFQASFQGEYLGSFGTAKEAAEAYRIKRSEIYGHAYPPCEVA